MLSSRNYLYRTKRTSILLGTIVGILLLRCHGNAYPIDKGLEANEKDNVTLAANTTHQAGLEEKEVENWMASSEEKTDEEEPLLFHRKCGRNAIVSEDRRTVHAISEEDEDGYSGVMTSRPLRDGEVFEIVHWDRLDETTKSEYLFDIGVTEFSPDELDQFPRRMEDIESGNWIANWTLPFYLKHGDTMGLMRTPNATLRLFVNGLDWGEVATEVPEGVHGFVEIYSNDEVEISIIDPFECNANLNDISSVYSQLNELNCALTLV